VFPEFPEIYQKVKTLAIQRKAANKEAKINLYKIVYHNDIPDDVLEQAFGTPGRTSTNPDILKAST
jgi:hypothetical protein